MYQCLLPPTAINLKLTIAAFMSKLGLLWNVQDRRLEHPYRIHKNK